MAVPVVLVVDDEPAVRELLRRWIEGWGYVVKLAGSATEALDVLLTAPASILICDIRMSGHDGLWLTERVHATWPNIAVIMVSGMSDEEMMTKARRNGAVEYVTKPFGREVLWHALTRAETTLHI
jgi:CheY-like chemotaxis protein